MTREAPGAIRANYLHSSIVNDHSLRCTIYQTMFVAWSQAVPIKPLSSYLVFGVLVLYHVMQSHGTMVHDQKIFAAMYRYIVSIYR
jgi:hypothetical protein